jgi:hypothetical protein
LRWCRHTVCRVPPVSQWCLCLHCAVPDMRWKQQHAASCCGPATPHRSHAPEPQGQHQRAPARRATHCAPLQQPWRVEAAPAWRHQCAGPAGSGSGHQLIGKCSRNMLQHGRRPCAKHTTADRLNINAPAASAEVPARQASGASETNAGTRCMARPRRCSLPPEQLQPAPGALLSAAPAAARHTRGSR